MKGDNCRSGCRTKDHETYAESTTGTVELSGENDTYLQMTYLGAVI